jgi:hypothetical protein
LIVVVIIVGKAQSYAIVTWDVCEKVVAVFSEYWDYYKSAPENVSKHSMAGVSSIELILQQIGVISYYTW